MIIMTVYDFSDWGAQAITAPECTGTGFIDDSDPAKMGGLGIGAGIHGKVRVTPSGFVGGENFEALARLKIATGSGGDGCKHNLLLFVTGDNDTIIAVGLRREEGGGEFKGLTIISDEGGGNCSTAISQISDLGITLNKWWWVKMRYIHGSQLVTFSYNDTKGASKPGDTEWTVFHSAAATIDKVVELGIKGYMEDWGNFGQDYSKYADDMEIIEVARGTELSLGTAKIQDIYSHSKTGGGGRAEFTIADPGMANKTTINNNIGKAITIKDFTHDKVMFKGEVSKYKVISDDVCKLEVKEASQKLLDNETNHNPIVYSGKVRHRKTDRLLDKDASFDATWGDNEYAITMEKPDDRRMKVYPHTGTFITDTDDERGSVDNLYFNDGDITDNALIARETPTEALSLALEFDVWHPALAVRLPTNVSFKFRAQNQTVSGKLQAVTIDIHNYNRVEDENIKNWTATSGIHSTNGGNQGLGGAGYDDFTDMYSWETDLDKVLDHSQIEYMDLITAENASGLTQYRMKFIITITLIGGAGTTQMAMQYAHIDMFSYADFDYPIVPKVGFGKLHTDTTSKILVFQNTGWGSIQMPAADGFSDGDDFFITKWIDDIVADCFTDSGLGLVLDWDVTDSDVYTIAEDLSIWKLFSVMQKFSSMFNAVWWFNGIDTVVARSTDNLSSTNTTLSEGDIEHFRDGNLKYDEDGDKLADKLTVEGRNVSYTIDPLSPEYTLDLDTAAIIIRDDSIVSTREAQRRAEGERIKHENTVKEIRLPMNFSSPKQSYANLNLGETVAYVAPTAATGNKFNFSNNVVDGNAADGEMLIIGWTYRWGFTTGYADIVELTLQRRYAS